MLKSLIILLLMATNLSFGDYLNSTDQYRIVLPDNWVQVQKETVRFLYEEMNFPAKEPAYGKYTYAYLTKPIDTLFKYPYILVQINNMGRLSWSEVKDMEPGVLKFDPETYYSWGESDTILTVIIPTHKGTINIFCYADKNDFPAYKKVFKNIINSIVVSTDLNYRRNIFRDMPVLGEIFWGDNSTGRLVFVFMILSIIVTVVRKRKDLRKN